MNRFLDIAEEVKAAQAAGKPVVALESTIISHGMPYPKNVETAIAVEQVVRDNGAVPATIAVLGGRLKAGLAADEIEYLGKKGLDASKASRRDLPVLIAGKMDGATTVAATMIIAEMADIPVFCTGGIGGVHRGAEQTMDISADLEELSRTGVAVVCAGAKSILNLELTMEYLETKGVPVIGYQTDTLPAFFTRSSQFSVDYRFDSPDQIAAVLWAKKQSTGGGMLIANPIPEVYSMDPGYIQDKIDEAVKEAERAGIKGKAITPYLLDRIQKETGGKSLEANIALVKNNAKLAALIAVAYQTCERTGQT